MPATSESQRKLMCLALSIKLGKAKGSPQATRMAKEMSVKQLSDFCKAPVKK